MAYCTRSNIEDRYGVTNVSRYADLDNDASPTSISNRITRAIAVADALIDDILRASPYSFVLPITEPMGTSSYAPVTLTDCAVKIAGYWLSTARGVKDYDKDGNPITRLYGDYMDARSTIKAIADQTIKLNVVI